MRTEYMKRVSLVMALLICVTMTTVMTLQPAQAKTKYYYLPSKITSYNYSGGKFVKDTESSLTYNKKGHVTTTKCTPGETRKLKYAYYKSGRLKKITCQGGEYFQFDKNGHLTTLRSLSSTEKAQYGKKRLKKYRENGEWFKFKYKYYSNGNMKCAEQRYVENSDDFVPEYKLALNTKGLIAKMSGNGFTAFKILYKYDKRGRAKYATVYRGSKKEARYIFSYKKARTTKNKSKYTALVNAYVIPYGPQSTIISVGGGYAAALFW